MSDKVKDLMLTTLFAIFGGLLISALLLLFLDLNPFTVFSLAFQKVISDQYTMGDIFLKATPLIFTALAFAFTYKASLFNIGAQGQFYAGSIVAIALSLQLQNVLPTALLLPLVMVCTFIAGGLIGGIIGYLKSYFGANEFLVSMMSTYVMVAIMNYLLRTFLKETKGEYPQTDALVKSAWIPNIVKGTRLHAGFIVAVVIALLVWVLLYKTQLGFRIRAVGSNAGAAKMSGINVKTIGIITFMISGGLAGLAGFTEINGVQHMLIQDFNPNLGAAGLGIAILANANPIGIIFASILFGAINVVGNMMGRLPGMNVPSSFIDLMQGLVMLFVIASYYLRHRLETRREKKKLMEVVSE
ncbi:MAG: ABC transporter permease [Clostridiaceae bacterium]